ncbi:transposase, partial [Lactobacillus buchneri]|nr:transposase [Lentilactobacillus buchneri]
KWPVDYYVYRERHLIENFFNQVPFTIHVERHLIEEVFNQLKNFWRIATRYDKLAHVYLERVYLAAILIRLK